MMVEPESSMEQRIWAILAEVVTTREIEAGVDTPLYAEGIELDSLETAEFSAVLEAEFGADPFTADEMPQTIGEILEFYRGQSAPQPADPRYDSMFGADPVVTAGPSDG